MRLPRPLAEPLRLRWPALVVLGAAVPPPALHAALASAAGTVFEAAPFVLAAEVLPRRFGAALAAAGCGCGRAGLPGALSLPATALCWLAFGPWIALARLAAGAALAAVRARGARQMPHARPHERRDALAELVAVAVPAALASLCIQTIHARAGAAGLAALQPWGRLAAALAGAALGAIVPCATGGVAVAAALAHDLPATAAGMLATAGLARFRGPVRPVPARSSAAFASVALALALATLVSRGPSGLVNPRLLPLDAAAAVAALAGVVRRRTATRAAPWLGIGLAGVLATGFAVPRDVATETTLAAAYPGERIDFTGVAHRDGPSTVVQRFAIACCRLDASPVAIRLSRRVAALDDSWISVAGTFAIRNGRLVVVPERWRRVRAPQDPFVYR